MAERSSFNPENRPKSWSEVIGPVALKGSLDPSLQKSGLVVLSTADDTEVCPVFQFDVDETGELSLNPHIAIAWALIQSLQVEQLGESPWTKAGSLMQPRDEHEGMSWVEILKAPKTDQSTRHEIYYSIVGDAVKAAMILGLDLTDPRYNLPR